MAKATMVQVPRDAGLARLLRAAPGGHPSGAVAQKVTGWLANAADPLSGCAQAVDVADPGTVAQVLAAAVPAARAAGDPAAEGLAALARQLGAAVPPPSPPPAAAPAAPAGTPAAAPPGTGS
jgi:hypothetical protein